MNPNYIQYFTFLFSKSKLYSILFIFIQYTLFQFSNLIFYSIISAVLSVSGLTHIKIAAEARWEEVLSSIDGLLIETESQDNNPVLGFHEAALLLNRLETAVSVLRSLFDMDLDLDRNINQVLGQMCSLLTDIYQYWNVLLDYGRRRILQTRGDHPLSSKRNY